MHPTLEQFRWWVGPAGQLLSWWSRAGTAIAIHSCQRCKGLETFPGSPGLTCWAVVVPRGHHRSWEECGGKERLVVWSCSLRSERRKKDAKEKQRNTGESRGLWREGRIWSCLERGLREAGEVLGRWQAEGWWIGTPRSPWLLYLRGG